MKILLNNDDLNEALNKVSKLGFVPTMGGLHKGHISLIKRSIKECKKTIVSIFINPTQFNNKKDFKKYPRNIKKDLSILKKMNGKKHSLISSVCISKNGSMIWNHTDKATLTMKKFSDEDLRKYLSKISDEALYAYNVYQIEGAGRNLFSEIEGDENTIMGLPIKKIKEYLNKI